MRIFPRSKQSTYFSHLGNSAITTRILSENRLVVEISLAANAPLIAPLSLGIDLAHYRNQKWVVDHSGNVARSLLVNKKNRKQSAGAANQ
jgi:hypothetical protein